MPHIPTTWRRYVMTTYGTSNDVTALHVSEHVSGAGSDRKTERNGAVSGRARNNEAGAGVMEWVQSSERTNLVSQISLKGDGLNPESEITNRE